MIVNGVKRHDRRRWLNAARHPTRRDGAVTIALLMLPWVVALVLARRHHHLDGGTVGILVAVSLGLPTLWLAWAAYRHPRRSGAPVSDLSMAQVADQLAVAVSVQWTAEAAVRRLNDPWPLPVSWDAADASLTDAWDLLVKLAVSGAGGPEPPPAGTWAAGPDDLAGEGGELVNVLARVPTGRMVVLGEPGAGKTMLMVRLVLDLLARRTGGEPVPFLASVASWNPAEQDLRGWLAAQLLIGHPALGDPPPAGMNESNQAAALLASGWILPVLDGLDEIPGEIRGPAISRINDALRLGEKMVVTCRTQHYRDAVRPADGVEMTIRAAAAVQLRSLSADAVRGYLYDDAAGPATRARWDPVIALLGTDAPVSQALSTPLMVSLARAIYNPRPGELIQDLRDPVELCGLPNQSAVSSHLLDAFIPAAYRISPGPGKLRWSASRAEDWFVFLARHLNNTTESPDLAWWTLQASVPAAILRFLVGLMTGFGAGIATGLVTGPALGPMAGLATALGVGIVSATCAGVAARWKLTHFADAWVLGSVNYMGGVTLFMLALRCGLGVGVGIAASLLLAPVTGPGIAIAVGATGGLVATAVAIIITSIESWQWKQIHGALSTADRFTFASPETTLARDRWMFLGQALAVGAVAGSVVGLPFGTGTKLGVGLGVGLGIGLMAVLTFKIYVTGGPLFEVTRIWLALRRRLPWALMDFLADAHRRGVLRQTGAFYQFRHIELQHRLAIRP